MNDLGCRRHPGHGWALLACALAAVLLPGTAPGAIVPAKKIQCANPSGDCHKVLVIPVAYPSICPAPGMPCSPGLVNNAFCPVLDTPCDPSLWLHTPRVSTQQLEAELEAVNALYDVWSFGTWQFDFDVLHNPDGGDGWWPLPASYQAYYASLQAGANFWQRGTAARAIVQDAVEAIAGPASEAGLIPSLLGYSRFVVVDGNHDRFGQALHAVVYNVPVETLAGVIPFPHLFGGSFVGVASNAADLRSVLAHELGHQAGLGLGYDLYGSCSIDETAQPPFVEECNGGWDIMALDALGPNHPTAYTKFAVGWIPDAPAHVTTLPPTPANGFFSLSIGPVETTGPDPRWVRIPTSTWKAGTPFEGYALECRRSIAGEVNLPEDGLLILRVRETDPGVALDGFKPVRAVRTAPVAPSWENAALQPGEGYGDPAEGLAIVFTGYGNPDADAPCLVEVTYSPLAAQPDPAIDPGLEGGGADLWLDSEANGYGNFPANQPVDAEGAPQGSGDPFRPGAWNRLYFRVRNVGNSVSPGTSIRLRAQQPPHATCGTEGPSILDVDEPIPALSAGGVYVGYVAIHPADPSPVLVRGDIDPVSGEATVGNNHAERTLYSHGASTLLLSNGGPTSLIVSPVFTNACGGSFQAVVVPRVLPTLDGPPEPDPALFWQVSGPGLLTVPDGASVFVPIEVSAPPAAAPGTVLETVLELQAGAASFSSPGAVAGEELETLLALPLRLAVVEPSTLTAALDTSVQRPNEAVGVIGLLLPAVQGSLLGIRYTAPSGVSIVHVAASDDSGAFVDRIVPDESGTWTAEVLWQGDDSRSEAAYGPLPFEILPPDPCLVNADCDDGVTCTADACDPGSGQCENVPVPPSAVSGVVFLDRTRLAWDAAGDAQTWNTYRGSAPAGGMGSRRDAYDHGCLEFADALRDGPTLTTDSESPPTGTGLYYLVTGDGPCGEGDAGAGPDGTPRPLDSVCP